MRKWSLCWAFFTTADALAIYVRSSAMCTPRDLKVETLFMQYPFICSGAMSPLCLLKSITIFFVLLVFRVKLFTDHHAAILWTSSLYFDSTLVMRPTSAVLMMLGGGRGCSDTCTTHTGRGSTRTPGESLHQVSEWRICGAQPSLFVGGPQKILIPVKG